MRTHADPDPQPFRKFSTNMNCWNCSNLLRFRFRFQFLLWKSFGSGSGLVSVPDPDFFSTVLQKIYTKPCLFNDRSSIVTQKSVSNLDFWTFILNFMLDRVQNRFRNRNRMHYGSGSDKAKSCGSYGSGSVSGSTTLIVPM
jgi:hypothetical protein